MKKTKSYRMPYRELKRIAEILKMKPASLSKILNGHVNISKKKAIMLSMEIKKAGYNFSPETWMFSPERIVEEITKKITKGITKPRVS